MEPLRTFLDYYQHNTGVFAVAAFIILGLLLFRFKSIFIRLLFIALILFGTYYFIAHFAGVASRGKRALIDQYFPRERMK